MTDTQSFTLTKFNWRWLVVTYCFLVLFHLLPTLLASDMWRFFFSRGIWRFFIWSGIGMACVTFYAGHRSSGTPILEAGIASMLYMATLIPTMSDIRDLGASGYRIIGLLVALHLLSLLIGCAGAVAGVMVRMRRERKRLLNQAGE